MNTVFRVYRQIYKYNMRLDTTAAALGMSTSKLRHKLADEGTNFSFMLRRVRLRMLDNLLRDNKTTQCIIYELGYGAPFELGRLCRKEYGMPYDEYRRGFVK